MNDGVYIIMLKWMFPSIIMYPELILDPEFGPLVFRKWHIGVSSLILILHENLEKGQLWCLMIDNATLESHGRESEPRWVHNSFFNKLDRVSRNELFLECGLLGV